MSNTHTLSETGAAVLRAAAEHPDHCAVPPERLPAAARNAVIASLVRAGLLEEVAPTGEGGHSVLRITQAGFTAIGQEPRGTGDEHGTSAGEEGGTGQPVLTLRDAAGAVLAAWDAGGEREGMSEALEAQRPALARRRAGRATRASTGPRKPREATK